MSSTKPVADTSLAQSTIEAVNALLLERNNLKAKLAATECMSALSERLCAQAEAQRDELLAACRAVLSDYERAHAQLSDGDWRLAIEIQHRHREQLRTAISHAEAA